ncbi:hypothetical protein KQ51_00985 [Candidatus Izimaplasma bacterium HR1]|jgi:hypothetical protein|uniref:hypothetical protein n=1 Tax=Candidatus Izimoplasma sp. HR1 TaxID=1541959 RepID=UPI0004F6028F|nr:hypothetical protein KQ51_00985 [Candidatus Izimaplasma bacterium HR1]
MIKKLLIALVALGALGGTVSAYAWWDTLQETQNETITVGEGTDLVVAVNATAPAGKVLIPTGFVLGVNDVNEIVLSYDVNLSKTAQSDLTLDVTASNVEIGGVTTNASLVNIVITPSSTNVNSGTTTVTVTITLTEPTTEAIYNAIINEDITFDLTFIAS